MSPATRWGRGGARAALLLALVALLPATACRKTRPQLARGDAAVVLVKPTAQVPEGVPVVAEQEPNSAPAPPMLLPLQAGASLAVQGTLGPGGEAEADREDVYAVELGGPAPPAAPGTPPAASDAAVVPAGHQLAIELTPDAPLATALVVRDAAGRVLGNSAGAPGSRHGLPNVAVSGQPGARYTLTVRRTGKPAPGPAGPAAPVAYLLVLRTAPLGAADEREPNDQASDATVLGPTHTEPQAAGFLGGKGSEDYFRVPLGETAEATVLHIELEVPSEATASVTVLDAQARKLAAVRGRKGERVVLRNLAPEVLVPPQPGAAGGLFYLVVRSEGAADLERRYVLGVRPELAPDREREPDDDPAQARAIGAAVTGHLGPADADVFKVTAPPGAEQQIELQPPRRLDVVLELMAPGATRWTRIDKAGRGQPERALVPAAATVSVRVSSKRPAESEADDTYQLVVTPAPAAAAAPPGPPP